MELNRILKRERSKVPFDTHSAIVGWNFSAAKYAPTKIPLEDRRCDTIDRPSRSSSGNTKPRGVSATVVACVLVFYKLLVRALDAHFCRFLDMLGVGRAENEGLIGSTLEFVYHGYGKCTRRKFWVAIGSNNKRPPSPSIHVICQNPSSRTLLNWWGTVAFRYPHSMRLAFRYTLMCITL
jgi:hypothetical protein